MYKKTGTAYLSGTPGFATSIDSFGGVRIIHLFNLFYLGFFWGGGGVLCLVPNAASVSGLSIFFLFPIRFSLRFTRLLCCVSCFALCVLCPLLPLSLDCPFFIAHSVFSNCVVLLVLFCVSCVQMFTCIYGLFILYCPFGSL